MQPIQYALFLLVSFGASVVGSICGIGGGVIIKPVLDMLGLASVSTISFLSGCTVLSMTCFSVGKSMLSRQRKVDLRSGTPLAIGSALGGVLGKSLFGLLKSMFADANKVGAVQALCLLVITIGTLLYTLNKDKIHTRRIANAFICALIGLALGVMSSFLGIGGGPVNLVVLYYFFSMDTKTAAENSLFIILFSQLASLISTLVTNSVPEFDIVSLAIMALGGILGGIAGRKINNRIGSGAVNKLFIALMIVIIVICARNAYMYC